MNLGADKPSKELMVKLIKASDKEQKKTLNQMAASNGVSTNSSDWHPEDLIEQFDEMYDVWGYSTTYNGRLQYHLIFQHEGNDPYLAKLTTKHVYNDFSAGSSTAEKWVDEILKVYAEKSTGAYLGLLNPVLNWLPWELLFDSKPSANDISSSTSATVFTLATNTTVKFVYIYDTNNEDWWFALSTNYVYWSWEVSEYVFKNGHSYQDEDSGSNIALYGDYYSASSDADEAFTNGHSRKTTIYKQALWSESFDRDEIVHNIHSPTFVAHMM